ncbi:MAG: FAD-binding protein, partial [Dehalococcoidia bacterium]|nr:FAD-binding protein [Dehalococcoidia bacterium]
MANPRRTEVIETDVLVIGGGLGGAYAAIKAREAGVSKVTLVSKGKLGKDSVATFAAGVWAGGFFPEEDDRDTEFKKIALSEGLGAGLYDEEWLNVFLDESYQRLVEMDSWGVEWEKTSDGRFERKECRWKQKMAMFHGQQMMEAMARKVIASGVQAIGFTMLTELLTEGGEPGRRVTGAIGFNVQTGEPVVFKARAIVMATGACAYKGRNAFNKFATGDGYWMAYRAGAKLGMFEIGEILQGSLREFDTVGWNMFVGLGAVFRNGKGERFLLEYAPEYGDHASLATVAEASAMEVRAGRGPIYLDMTSYKPNDVRKLRTACPVPAMMLESAGVMAGDRIVKQVEWLNCVNGSIALGGGIVTDVRCQTSLPGLFACGDARARGRASATQLPGAAVSGARAGTYAAQYAKQSAEPKIDTRQLEQCQKLTYAPLDRKDGIEPDHVIIAVQEAVFPYEVTVISRGDRMEKAIAEIERIREDEVPLLYASDPHYLRIANEARNCVLFAEMQLRS